VLLISFAGNMTTWQAPGNDAMTTATPLAMGLDAMTTPTTSVPGTSFSYFEMFIGQIGGSMGETCKLALLIGFVYLLARKVITATAPLAFMGTVFVLSFVFGADPFYHLLAGGVILGAVFMATDYVTSPTTEAGKLIFGIGCGLITVVIRLWAAYPEGVSFAILLMNILTPHIDSLTAHKAFGGRYEK
jgi:electron transport complex protein RnfD